MLVEHARHWPVLRPLVEDDWIVGPGIATLRKHPAFARRLADSGRDMHVWTVNTEGDLQTCLDLGVEAVITDRPASCSTCSTSRPPSRSSGHAWPRRGRRRPIGRRGPR